MPAFAIIPARYKSTRFPGKPLCLLAGKPMIQWVYEGVKGSKSIKEAFVATDHELIYDTVNGFGGKVIMTKEDHQSGTDRIAEAAIKLVEQGYDIKESDIIVNVQGDEPMIEPEMVDKVVSVMEDERADIGTLVKKIEDFSEVLNPNVVKVVFDKEGFALYFSRAPIPYHRDKWKKLEDPLPGNDKFMVFKHIGIYAYRKDFLLKFSNLSPTRLEAIERLEQLRALENGFRIKVIETEKETIGVDTLEDLRKVEKCLNISL